MEKLKELNEKELREFNVPWPKTIEELNEIIKAVTERPHEYGTCVYAMSIAAIAAFYYVSGQLGVTGFQVSCADLDFLKRSRGFKHGFKILNFEDLLYPQYWTDEKFPSAQYMLEKNLDTLRPMAKRNLEESRETAHPDVVAHWERIANYPEV